MCNNNVLYWKKKPLNLNIRYTLTPVRIEQLSEQHGLSEMDRQVIGLTKFVQIFLYRVRF